MAIHSNLKVGDMFGRYRLEKFLGAGGFAVVWKAFDTLTNTMVALKIFSTLDDQSILDLAAEYAQAHNLSHSNIVRAEHFDSMQNIPYLVMKYCSGGNLEHAPGKMPETEVLEMLRQLADALIYVHAQGLVHQDIKPANILTEPTTRGTRYLLSDFGISAKSRTRLSKSMSEGVQSGQYMTYAYAPPEKFSPIKADRVPHRKGDIFSLGITAFELATGHLPFDDLDTGRELQYRPELTINVEEITNPTLRNIIGACLLTDRDSRPDPEMILQWIKYARLHNGHIQPETAGANFTQATSPRKPIRIDVSGGGTPPLIPSKSRRKSGVPGWLVALLIIVPLVILVLCFLYVSENNHNNSHSPEVENIALVPTDTCAEVTVDSTGTDTIVIDNPKSAYIEKTDDIGDGYGYYDEYTEVADSTPTAL